MQTNIKYIERPISGNNDVLPSFCITDSILFFVHLEATFLVKYLTKKKNDFVAASAAVEITTDVCNLQLNIHLFSPYPPPKPKKNEKQKEIVFRPFFQTGEISTIK